MTDKLLPLCGILLLLAAEGASAEKPVRSSPFFRFRYHDISRESEYGACAALDVDGDGKKDVVCGGYWYQAPDWKRHFLRDVERIGNRFDDYSSLPLDVNGDGHLDLVSANYRSKTLYWVQHPGKALIKDRGTPWTRHVIAEPGPSETGRLYDIDGDGKLDLLPNGTTYAAWWSLAAEQGKPVWTRHELPQELAGHGLGFGDLNGDGRGDIVSPRGWAEAPKDRRKERWVFHSDFRLAPDLQHPDLCSRCRPRRRCRLNLQPSPPSWAVLGGATFRRPPCREMADPRDRHRDFPGTCPPSR